MASYDALIDAQLSGATVRAAMLVHFDFVTSERRLWEGATRLVAGGATWEPSHGLGSISAVGQDFAGGVDEITFSIPADAAMLALLSADRDQIDGSEANVYAQFFDLRQFDEAGAWVDFAPIGDPRLIHWGRLGQLVGERSPGGPDNRPVRSISVTSTSVIVNRARPAFAYWSDRDQQARAPGDNMFINMSRVTQTLHWPLFNG